MTKIEKPVQLETYNLLRAALSLFKKSPAELAEAELQQAKIQALNEFSIESRVLNAPEASAVFITDQELQQAYQEIRDRYHDENDFFSDLEKNQLNKASLLAALHRQCKVNTVLELIASRAPAISEVDIGIYYHLHAEQFNLPERREVCHIFISINPDYAENTLETALLRAQELAEKLHKKPHKFADLALRHSECPTALQGGVLGIVPRGTLYPELDAVLFNLKAGQVSDVVKSEIGFHVLLCKSIQKHETLSLAKATPKIRQLMKERARRTCQRAWLASLTTSESGESSHER
ncbi:nitrogen fixation protein NifM [Methylobacter svalbardensis]|uniref:nitrogen fixation protein NifM n=1 Tax=Methylobacter svalbardensis TaxID=3080016 RepID=UPI0030EE7FC9